MENARYSGPAVSHMGINPVQSEVNSVGSVTYLHRAFDRGMETATRFPVPLHMIHMPAQTAWGCPSWVLHLFPCLRSVDGL